MLVCLWKTEVNFIGQTEEYQNACVASKHPLRTLEEEDLGRNLIGKEYLKFSRRVGEKLLLPRTVSGMSDGRRNGIISNKPLVDKQQIWGNKIWRQLFLLSRLLKFNCRNRNDFWYCYCSHLVAVLLFIISFEYLFVSFPKTLKPS